MNYTNGSYASPGWLRGAHAQTIYPVLLRAPRIVYRRQRIDTPDGDFIDFDWMDAPAHVGGAPVVVLFHGLEGSSSSHYARALMRQLQAIGWHGVVPHFRGCSGELNRCPRAYHSGDYAEVGWMLRTVRALAPDVPLYAVGISLGGSALLNWLGREEHAAARLVTGAAAVSTPLDLTAAGIAIGQGFNRIYSLHFLQTLKPKALAMARRFAGVLDEAAIRKADSLYKFDNLVTAPLHGFATTEDYWTRASSKQWLRSVAIPTLVLNARNDPFVPDTSLPGVSQASRAVTLEQPQYGGHAGFMAAPFPGRLDWLPMRLVEFMRNSS